MKEQSRDSLGDRIKEYESKTRYELIPKTPVIIRLDGKAFHSFTKSFKKPFDERITTAMQMTAQKLCEEIQNVGFAYTQSDEITLFLRDYTSKEQQQYFGGNIQKITSVSSSIATYWFNLIIKNLLRLEALDSAHKEIQSGKSQLLLHEKLRAAVEQEKQLRPAYFDSRVFNVPQHEVINVLIWRQQDGIRNSINSVGQSHFSHSQLQNKNTDQVRAMLLEKEVKWEDLAPQYQRGSCVIKKEATITREVVTKQGPETVEVTRGKWEVDKEIPIFTENRSYIEQFVISKEEGE